jgi:hypothetical protein
MPSPAQPFTCVLAFTSALAAAQADDLREVLLRMHAYVTEYEDTLAAFKAEEEYQQEVVGLDGVVRQRRVLRSDYLVFQLPPDERWFAFRDVFDVDGVAVRDPGERLNGLVDEDEAAVDAALRLHEESARYNIGRVVRTLNLPTFALAFFRPANRRHFQFEKAGEEDLPRGHAWVIAYSEIGRPQFVATPSGKDLPVSGRVWVDPESGRILKTELNIGAAGRQRQRGRIVVSYRPEETLSLWVPDTMEELYDDERPSVSSEIVRGRAVYSQVRPVPVKGRLLGR